MKNNVLKRVLSLMCVSALMVGCFAGCGETKNETAASNSSNGDATEEVAEADENDNALDGAGLKFAYVVRDTGSIYSQYIKDFEDSCKAVGVEPVIISYEGDTAKWPDALENAVTVGVDAVYTWPDDQAMADFAGQYYAGEGIPCVSMGIDSEYCDAVLTGDQVAMGNELGEMVAAWVEKNYGDEPFEWALLEYTSAAHVTARSKAMEDTVTELCPNGVEVDALEAQTLEEGQEQTENLLQMHPDVKLLVCCEDTAAMGAVEVFREAGKTGDEYAIFGACFGDQVGNAIIKGDVYRESIAFENFGKYVVEGMLKLCKGEEIDHEIYGGFLAVTKDNVEEVMEYFGYEVK